MIKRILSYVLVSLVAIVIFYGGLLVGLRVFAQMKNTTILQDYMVNSMIQTSVLHYLDQGKNKQARQLLMTAQDGTIMTIDALAENADKQSRITACNILKGIARNRKESPSLYASYSDGVSEKDTEDIKKDIARILDKWAAVSCGETR